MSKSETPEDLTSDDHMVRRGIFGAKLRVTVPAVDSTRSQITSVEYALRTTNIGDGVITNNYAAPEVVALGTACEIVCGSTKGIIYDDGPGQPRRESEIEDAE
ncbi:MAG TPA: hypothetical protein VFP64_21195 [Pyrinomonadaceae bacterium]|nr:hypothetical protein [Pyrinomonadaceae bacterium]